MQKAKNSASAADELFFDHLDGKASAPAASGSEVLLEQVPADVEASLSVEDILADTAAKLERRAAEIARRQAEEAALEKAAAEKAKDLETQARADDELAAAQDEQKARCVAHVAALRAMAAGKPAAEEPAAPAAKPAKKAA